MPYFSVIIPVYNRPDEVRELLESLSKQTLKDFEVLLIEDGSVNRCDTVAQEFDKDLNICYFYKENSGRSLTRNYGMERASGEYLIFFDSDCIIPRSVISRLSKLAWRKIMSIVSAGLMRHILLLVICKRRSAIL